LLDKWLDLVFAAKAAASITFSFPIELIKLLLGFEIELFLGFLDAIQSVWDGVVDKVVERSTHDNQGRVNSREDLTEGVASLPDCLTVDTLLTNQIQVGRALERTHDS